MFSIHTLIICALMILSLYLSFVSMGEPRLSLTFMLRVMRAFARPRPLLCAAGGGGPRDPEWVLGGRRLNGAVVGCRVAMRTYQDGA